MRGSNCLMDTLRDRIEFIMEQYLHGKSSKLILIVICPLSFVLYE
ncbi:MAG: hypothetical protein RMZ41_017885 [Nostoc sp. DedVER02]